MQLESTIKRRDKIIEYLDRAESAITGSFLSENLGVSRQIIVQDIAILRANGKDIKATPSGYTLNKKDMGIIKRVAVKHSSDNIKEELEIFINSGAKIIDVIVEHPVYGEIKGNLNIKNNTELNDFLKKSERNSAKMLSELTEGVHIHTVSFDNEKNYEVLIEKLKEKNYLLE